MFAASATLVMGGCGELSKLIPIRPSKDQPGLQQRDFRSSFGPNELVWDTSAELYGLRGDLAPATQKFESAGEDRLVAGLRSFAELSARPTRLRVVGWNEDGGPGGFLKALPPLPSIFDVGTELGRFRAETPNVKTDLTAALNPETSQPLVLNRISQVFELKKETLSEHDFGVYESRGLVFTGLATKFDENTRLAAEAGIGEASEKPVSGWTVSRARSVLIFARSLQPSNEFQALMECLSVTLDFPSESPPATVSLSWPRLIIRESSPSMLDRPKKNLGVSAVAGSTEPSQLRIENRPALFVTRQSPPPGQPDAALLVFTAPPRDEVLLTREPAAATVRWGRLRYDGASNGQQYSLFHEARRFFLYRFLFTDVGTLQVEHASAAFRMPYAASVVRVEARRNEFGQWRRALSPEQKTYVKEERNAETSSPPSDRWTLLQALHATTDKGQKRPLASVAETAKNGIAAVDTAKLAGDLSDFFLQPPVRNSAADSALVTREKYAEIEALCRRAFF